MKRIAAAFSAILVLTFPGLVQASSWTIDPQHSYVGFSVRHVMIADVRGSFEKFSGTVEIDDEDITRSKVEVSIDVNSVDTNVDKRDEHLRSPDFFDVAKFPTMTFVSKKIIQSDKDELKITGDLTLHGITREVVLEVDGPTKEIKDPWGHMRRGASASTKINRKDFGMTWNKSLETGGVTIGDEIKIELEVEMVKK